MTDDTQSERASNKRRISIEITTETRSRGAPKSARRRKLEVAAWVAGIVGTTYVLIEGLLGLL